MVVACKNFITLKILFLAVKEESTSARHTNSFSGIVKQNLLQIILGKFQGLHVPSVADCG